MRRHAGEERRVPAAGGDVHAAAELSGVDLPAGAAERADRGAAATGGPGEGAGAELQPAGWDKPAGRRDEEAPTQQEEPGGSRETGGEGHADADDLLHGPCKTPEPRNGGASL